MNSSLKRVAFLAAVAFAAVAAVGAGAASAHGGGGRDYGLRVSTSSLVTQAAKELDVTRAKLVTAIKDAAVTRINAAQAAGDLDVEEAAEYKDEAQDNLGFAYRVSRTRAVASNLGITVAKLNNGFRAARTTLILAAINEAVADGRLTAAQAADLKEDLEDVDLPGYKAVGFGGLGYAGGRC
jgi:hypothetical protein